MRGKEEEPQSIDGKEKELARKPTEEKYIKDIHKSGKFYEGNSMAI